MVGDTLTLTQIQLAHVFLITMAANVSISAIKILVTPLAQQVSPVILVEARGNAFVVPRTIGLDAFASTNAMRAVLENFVNTLALI